jgi:Lsr2
VARETITKLIDDLDGGEAHETVRFGLDGHSYEIDLSTKNATKLRNALAGYVESGTRVSGRSVGLINRSTSRGRGGAVAERDQNKAIRSWALRKGLDVAPRGRIRQDVVEQYHREAGR